MEQKLVAMKVAGVGLYLNGNEKELLINSCANFKQLCLERAVPHAANKGLKEMAGEVVNQTFVHLINSYSRFTVRASKPPLL